MQLSFCGYPIRISKEREAYVELRKEFDSLADSLTEEFSDIYAKEYKNIDSVVKNAFQQGMIQINKALVQAHNMLIQSGIYELDQESFVEEYYSRYCDWDDCFNRINDKYMDIVLTEEEKDAYRKARRQNRGRWVGGGYGLGGAVKGSVQAGALNMASGVVHGAFNLTAKGISAIGAGMKKSRLYNDPDTRTSLEDGVYRNIYVIIYAFMEALSDYKDVYFDLVSAEDERRAQSLANNLSVIPDQKEKIIAEILSLNPFHEDVYKYAIINNLDINYEFGEIGQYFDIDICDYVNMFIADKLDKLDVNSKKELQDSKAYILDILGHYEIDIEECPILLEVDRNLERIDIEERTYNGILFPTRQIREKAEADHKEIDKICADCADMSKAELEETIEKLETGGYEKEIVTVYFEKVQKYYETVEQRTLDAMIAKAEGDRAELCLLKKEIKNLGYDAARITNAETVICDKIRALDTADLDRLCKNMYEFDDQQYDEVCGQIDHLDCDQDLKEPYLEKLNYLKKFTMLDSFPKEELQNLYEKINDQILDDRQKEYAEKIERAYYMKIQGRLVPYLSELEALAFHLNQDLFFAGMKVQENGINKLAVFSAAHKHMAACGHPYYYKIPVIASEKYFGITTDTLFIGQYDTHEEIKLEEVNHFTYEKHILLSKLNIEYQDKSTKSIYIDFPKKTMDGYLRVLNLALEIFGRQNEMENPYMDENFNGAVQDHINTVQQDYAEDCSGAGKNLDGIVQSIQKKYDGDPKAKKCSYISFRGRDGFEEKVIKVLSVITLRDPGNEIPLFVYDDTIFESGKAGALITDKRVYAIKQRKYMEIEKIRCVSASVNALCFETEEGIFETKCVVLNRRERDTLAKYLSELIGKINADIRKDEQTKIPLDAVFCPRCRRKMPLESKFCSMCGQKIC